MNDRCVQNTKREIFWLVLLCLISNTYKIIFSICFSNPSLQTPQDGFSTIYAAGYFAGKDWSLIGKEFSAYYGYGFFSFFSLLYRVLSDGLLIYRLILLCCNLLNIISCIFCYKIAKEFLDSECKWILYLICISSTSVLGTSGCGISNEYALNVCVWAVLYLILKLCNWNITRNNRIKYTLLLGVLLAYSCSVHARAAVMYLLVALCCIIIGIKRKKILLHIPTAIISCTLFIPYKLYTNYLQIKLLGEINANSSIVAKVSNGTKNDFSLSQIYTFLISVFMYVHELNVITVGIIAIAIVAVVYVIIQAVYKKNHIIEMSDRQLDQMLCGMIFTIFGIGAFIFGMCYSTHSEIYKGITVPISEHLRYLTLVRYMMPFISPFVFFTLVLTMKISNKERHTIANASIITYIILQIIFLFQIYPNIKFTGWAYGVYIPYTWDIEMERSAVYLIGGCMIPIIFFIILIINLRNRKWYPIFICIFIFSTIGISYRYMHQYYKCNYFDLVDGGYYYFKDYDEGEIYVVVKNDEEETTDDITQYYFLYQMLLPNIKIIPEKPENASEGTMILTNNIEFISNYEEYIITQLDSNEYLCVKQ